MHTQVLSLCRCSSIYSKDLNDLQVKYTLCSVTALWQLSRQGHRHQDIGFHYTAILRGCPQVLQSAPRLHPLNCGMKPFISDLRRGRNYFLHRLQNCWSSCYTQYHRFLGLFTSVSSSASGANGLKICPTRKLFGESGEISFGSELTYVIGLEVVQHRIWLYV